MNLEPSKIRFIQDEPAFLLNNMGTCLPTHREDMEKTTKGDVDSILNQ